MTRSNVLGLGGVVVRSSSMVAFPAQTPLTEMASPLFTSEKLIVPVLLTLCILIMTPCRNRVAVIWPMPEKKLQVMLAGTGFVLASVAATKLLSVNAGIAMGAAVADDVFLAVFFLAAFFLGADFFAIVVYIIT